MIESRFVGCLHRQPVYGGWEVKFDRGRPRVAVEATAQTDCCLPIREDAAGRYVGVRCPDCGSDELARGDRGRVECEDCGSKLADSRYHWVFGEHKATQPFDAFADQSCVIRRAMVMLVKQPGAVHSALSGRWRWRRSLLSATGRLPRAWTGEDLAAAVALARDRLIDGPAVTQIDGIRLWLIASADEPTLPRPRWDPAAERPGLRSGAIGRGCPLGKDCGCGGVLERLVSEHGSYKAARYRRQVLNAKNRPFWQFDAYPYPLANGGACASHFALDGLVFRHDDPFWHDFYPPLGPGCRCRVRARIRPGTIARPQVSCSAGRQSVEEGAAVYRFDDTAETVRVPAEYRGVPPIDGYPGAASVRFVCLECGRVHGKDRRLVRRRTQ